MSEWTTEMEERAKRIVGTLDGLAATAGVLERSSAEMLTAALAEIRHLRRELWAARQVIVDCGASLHWHHVRLDFALPGELPTYEEVSR